MRDIKPKRLLRLVLLISAAFLVFAMFSTHGKSPTSLIFDMQGDDQDCQRTSFLCEERNNFTLSKETESLEQLKQEFYDMMTTVAEGACSNYTVFGRHTDGGYDVCVEPTSLAPTPGNCLVYSFGISVDWSFDDHMASHGCEVHSFDPSIRLKSHTRAEHHFFHDVGLWGDDIVNREQWKLQSLASLRSDLGHQQRVIDVLKVDVEGAEWSFLRSVVDSDQLRTVRQLLVEYHTPVYKDRNLTAPQLASMLYYTHRLRQLGFNVFRNKLTNGCCARFGTMFPSTARSERCCYETFYVNNAVESFGKTRRRSSRRNRLRRVHKPEQTNRFKF